MSDTMTPAEKHYHAHLSNVRAYQKRNPDKMREKQQYYSQKMKLDKPEKYAELLAKKREYYANVVKPKKLLKENDALASNAPDSK